MTSPLPRRPPSTSSARSACWPIRTTSTSAAPAPSPTWTAAGTEVTYCIVTDGDAGGFDETPREQMGPLRQAEQRAAAAAVGVTDVRFLGYPDGRLELTLDLRRDISRVIRQVRPQRVLTTLAGAVLGPDRRQPSRPHDGGRVDAAGGLPRRPQPVRVPRTARRRGPRGVDGRGGVAEREPPSRPRRRRHRDRRPQVRRAALPRHPDEPLPRPGEVRDRVDEPDRAAVRPPEGRLAEAFHVVHTPETLPDGRRAMAELVDEAEGGDVTRGRCSARRGCGRARSSSRSGGRSSSSSSSRPRG